MNQKLTRIKTAAVVGIPLLIMGLLGLTGCAPNKPKERVQDKLTLEYSIDRETIHIGDPVELILTAYFPTNGILELPELGREKEILLINRTWENRPREDGLIQSETRYALTSFKLGDSFVSTNRITCRIGEKMFSSPFPKVVLHVQSALMDSESGELADIKPVHKLPGRIPGWVGVTLLTAAIAFLIGLITSKLWKHREHLIPTAPPIPPHVLALHALEALKQKGLLEKDECNPFYTELSLILRAYLEGRFLLNAPDETTEEIVEELSKSADLDGNQRNILQDFMRQADIVKFAKGHPDRGTMEAAFSTTQQFVKETKRAELTPKTDS